MANTTGYMGFKHIGFLPGYAPDYQLMAKPITNANATAIYRGDAVVFASGYIQRAENGTAAVDGVFDGCYFTDSNGKTNYQSYCPASQTATAQVISAPGALFLAQSNNTAITRANTNKNAGFVVGTGQTTGGQFSLYQLDAANFSTAASFPFRIVQLYSDIAPSSVNGTDNSSANNMAVVTFNSQDFKAGQTGV